MWKMSRDNEDRIVERAAGLAKDIAPERDLWPGIEAAIADTPRRGRGSNHDRRWSWFAQAAAVVLLVGASSGITYVAVKDDGPAVAITPDLLFAQTSFAEYELGPDFQDARRRLAVRLENELERLPPETRAAVEDNLTLIRTAIADINMALEQQPHNTLLQQLLVSTYREELELMRRVGGLTQEVMIRNYGSRSDI